jgi:hypothetical protein
LSHAELAAIVALATGYELTSNDGGRRLKILSGKWGNAYFADFGRVVSNTEIIPQPLQNLSIL